MKPLSLVLEAPPERWAWGIELGEVSVLARAEPELIKHEWLPIKHWRYSATESKAIWCGAGSFRGETPGSASA